MNILIVDDTQENLVAAREAAKNFSEHEFVFLSSASEALSVLPNVDGVISDFFFVSETNKEIEKLYKEYCQLAQTAGKSELFLNLTEEYYRGISDNAIKSMRQAIEVLLDGNPKKRYERLGKPAPAMSEQYAYGGGLLLEATKIGKKNVLVTNLHSHGVKFTQPDVSLAVDGVCVLMPLVMAGVLTLKDIMTDGVNSIHYYGGDAMNGQEKKDPYVWKEAIRRLLSQ